MQQLFKSKLRTSPEHFQFQNHDSDGFVEFGKILANAVLVTSLERWARNLLESTLIFYFALMLQNVADKQFTFSHDKRLQYDNYHISKLLFFKISGNKIHMNPLQNCNYIYKQECIQVGCVPFAAVAVCWGCLPRGGVCPGVSAQGGCVSQHALGQTPPPPCGQNDRQV